MLNKKIICADNLNSDKLISDSAPTSIILKFFRPKRNNDLFEDIPLILTALKYLKKKFRKFGEKIKLLKNPKDILNTPKNQRNKTEIAETKE